MNFIKAKSWKWFSHKPHGITLLTRRDITKVTHERSVSASQWKGTYTSLLLPIAQISLIRLSTIIIYGDGHSRKSGFFKQTKGWGISSKDRLVDLSWEAARQYNSPCIKRILKQGRANGLKFTSDCSMLVIYIFIYKKLQNHMCISQFNKWLLSSLLNMIQVVELCNVARGLCHLLVRLLHGFNITTIVRTSRSTPSNTFIQCFGRLLDIIGRDLSVFKTNPCITSISNVHLFMWVLRIWSWDAPT